MKAETDPISPDEFLLRRVHMSKFKSANPPVVIPNAFEPMMPPKARKPDTTGISLHRESCLNAPEHSLSEIPLEKRGANGLVRLRVSVLVELGVTLIPEKDPESTVPGHVVLHDLRCDEYTRDLKSCKRLMEKLAAEANRPENIVRIPPSLLPPPAPVPPTPGSLTAS